MLKGMLLKSHLPEQLPGKLVAGGDGIGIRDRRGHGASHDLAGRDRQSQDEGHDDHRQTRSISLCPHGSPLHNVAPRQSWCGHDYVGREIRPGDSAVELDDLA